MATKRKLECEEKVTGYVHNVSAVTNAARSNTRYFSGSIQTQHDEFIRFVSFSPEKQPKLKSAEASKSPVNVTGFIITPKGNSKEITIRKNSEVTVCTRLDFERSTRQKEKSKFMSLSNVETADTMCSIKAKILTTSTTNLVQTKYGERQLQTVTIADESKPMTLSLWQQHVNRVEQGRYYSIQNVISRNFQGELQLATTAKTIIDPTEAFIVTDDESPRTTQTVTGKVPCCNLKVTTRCLNCKKPIDTETATREIVRCEHCFSEQKLSKANLTRTLNLQLATGDMVQKFIMFNDVLSDFLKKHNLESLNTDETENKILSTVVFELEHKMNSDVVTQLNIKEKDM